MKARDCCQFCLLLVIAGCGESRGVIPLGGTNETLIDAKAYNEKTGQKEINPNAEVISLPRIDLDDPETFPNKSDTLLPRRKAGTSLRLVGMVTHPSPLPKGARITIRFWSQATVRGVPTPPGRGHAMGWIDGNAEARPGGLPQEWYYEIDGKLPERGHYQLTMEIYTAVLDPDMSTPPMELLKTWVVAEGDLEVD
jgi:hypothetical protein